MAAIRDFILLKMQTLLVNAFLWARKMDIIIEAFINYILFNSNGFCFKAQVEKF